MLPFRSALLASLVGLVAAVPAAASCKSDAGRTVAQNKKVRVYSFRDQDDRMYYACVRRTGRSFYLDATSFRTSIRGIRLRGIYVKWESAQVSEKSDYTLAVTVKNAATQRSFGWSFDSYSPVMDDKPDLAVIGERLKANGSYAFMVGPYDHPWPTRTYAVYRRDRRGRKQLDIGEDIEPDSFHATTTTLSWVRAGPSRTASFR